MGFLIKDLSINNDGEGWIFISDQHKVINFIVTIHFILPWHTTL